MRIILTMLAISCLIRCQADHLTSLLQAEINSLQSSTLQEQTSPLLYGMLFRLTQAAHIPMPKNISIFNAHYETTRKDEFKNTIVEKHTAYIQTYFDIFGNLIIYREILLNTSYTELEGILALAAAEHANSKMAKQMLASAGTFVATVLSTLSLTRIPNLPLDSDTVVAGGIHVGLLGSLLSFIKVGKSIQKNSVFTALSLTNPAHVRDGLLALSRIREQNSAPNIIEKVFQTFHLKKLHSLLKKAFSSHNSKETLMAELDRYFEQQ